MNYDVKPNDALRTELQKYVETFVNSQRRFKEDSMQRALNWLELSTNQYPILAELVLTMEDKPEQFGAVLDCLGVLIDLDIIDEFFKV